MGKKLLILGIILNCSYNLFAEEVTLLPITPIVLPTLEQLREEAQFQPYRAQEISQTIQESYDRSGVGEAKLIELPLPDDEEIQALHRVGFTVLAQRLAMQKQFLQKATPLYAKYPVLTLKQVKKFQQTLRMLTERQGDCRWWSNGECQSYATLYEDLQIIKLQKYVKGIPPKQILQKMAQFANEFDVLKIAYIDTVKSNDPLLLGQIDGSDDYFVLAQWGNDITCEEVLQLGKP